MNKYLCIASFFGATAVILGAFAAHGLENKLSLESIESIHTAVRYQLFHALLLLFVASSDKFTTKQNNLLSLFLIIGITFFSGSIYAIYLLQIPAKTIWFITPLGGFLLVVTWIFMFFIFFKKVLKQE